MDLDGVLGVAVIVAFLVGLTGAVSVTPAGRRAKEEIASRWGGRDGADGRPGRPGRPGGSASAAGRMTGWASGLAGAVRAGVDKIRTRRGGSTPAASGASSATGGTGPTTGGPTVDTARPSGPSAPGGGAGDLFDQEADRPEAPDADLPPKPQAAATAVGGGTGPIPTSTPDTDYVDADEFWPTPPAVRAAPAEPAEPMPALTAADTTDTEDSMTQELDTVSAGVAISHQQARAALARIRGNVALQRQIAAQNSTALSTLAAYWEQVGMDPVVLVAIYEAMMTSQTSRSSADLLLALSDRVSAVLASRGHDAVAAVAAGLNLAKDSGYYTQQ